MRQEINDNQLDEIVGGTTCLSESQNRISFTTLNTGYPLKCDFKTARSFLVGLFAEYPDMTEEEFDRFARKEFRAKGYI